MKKTKKYEFVNKRVVFLFAFIAVHLFFIVATENKSTMSRVVARAAIPVRPKQDVAPAGAPVWWADHEQANFDQWNAEGAITRSGVANATIFKGIAHAGRYSARLAITTTASVANHGVWLNQFGAISKYSEAYYGAYFYFPTAYAVKDWWNIMQFQSEFKNTNSVWATPWSVHVGNTSDGRMALWVLERTYELKSPSATGDSIEHKNALAAVTLPVGQWVYIEVYLKQATPSKKNGEVIVRQDGVELFHFKNVPTRVEQQDQILWSVNNYAFSVSPSPTVIYVDDAAIRIPSATSTSPRVWLPAVKRK